MNVLRSVEADERRDHECDATNGITDHNLCRNLSDGGIPRLASVAQAEPKGNDEKNDGEND